MSFFRIEPHTAGQWGNNTVEDRSAHPPRVTRLHYEFDDWLGEDLLGFLSTFIVTKLLMERLRQGGFTGCEFDEVEITKGEQFDELTGGIALPEFSWLKITGVAGRDDFGLSTDGVLVISDRVLPCLMNVKSIELLDLP